MMNPIVPPVGAAGGSIRQPRRRMILLSLLLCTWLFNASPFAGATVFAQATETVIDSTEERFTVSLDQPFALRVEQTAEIAGEDLIVELLYLDETSGCTDASCTELAVSAALYTKTGDQQISNSFSTTFAPAEPYVVESEGYDIWVLNVTTAADDSPVLVLQVVRNTTAATSSTVDFAPLYVDECPNLSQFDAAVVLQDLVNDQEPIGNLIFGPFVAASPLRQAATPPATPIRAAGDTVAVALDQPFILTLGQTGEIADLDFKLTFRSASDDSGCQSADDCSTMIFNGTLTFQKGEESNFAQAMAFIPEGAAFSTDFAGYLIYLTRIEKVAKGDFAATFLITTASEPTPTVTATPSPTAPQPKPTASRPSPTATPQPKPTTEPHLTACPFLSTDEASAILATTMKAQEGDMRAQDNLLCAYRSVDGTTTSLLATYGPFTPRRFILDWIAAAAPNEDKLVRQAQNALKEGNTHQYLDAIVAIAQKLDDWSVVQSRDEQMTVYYLRHATVGGQQIYWVALHPTDLMAAEMLITAPLTLDEAALRDSLHQHSERVLADAMQAYRAAWPLIRDRLISARGQEDR